MAAIVFCGDTHIVDFSVVNGRQVVKDGKLCLIDEMEIFHEANRWSQYMLETAKKKTGIDMCSKEGPGMEAPRPSLEQKK